MRSASFSPGLVQSCLKSACYLSVWLVILLSSQFQSYIYTSTSQSCFAKMKIRSWPSLLQVLSSPGNKFRAPWHGFKFWPLSFILMACTSNSNRLHSCYIRLVTISWTCYFMPANFHWCHFISATHTHTHLYVCYFVYPFANCHFYKTVLEFCRC